MTKILTIGAGGFFGSILRYVLSAFLQKSFSSSFPVGTLAVNLIGCLAIGFFAGLANNRGLFAPEVRNFLFIGLFGGFTTFSTFSYETNMLLNDSQYIKALLNVSLQVFFGIFLCFAGYKISELL